MPSPDKTGNNRNQKGQFEQGKSGNPNGRPKGTKSIPDILKKIGRENAPTELKKILENTFGKGDAEMSMQEAVLSTAYLYAIRGKQWAIQFIADRTEGKPIQPTADATDEWERVIKECAEFSDQ